MEYLFIISIGLLGFFFFSLLSRPGKKLSEWIFMSWILLLLVTEVSFFVYAQGNAGKHPIFITAICDSHLLHPFFMYLYTKAFTDEHFKIRPKILLHLIPLVTLLLAKLYTNFGLGVMECYEDGSCLNADNSYVTGFYIFKYLIMLIYIYQCHKLVQQHQNNIKSQEDIYKNLWIRNLIKGTFFLFIGILLIQIFRVAFPIHLYDRMLITSTMATLFIYILLYMANSHAFIFVREKTLNTAPVPKTKDSKVTTRISKEDQELFIKVEEYITTNKSYLNGMLTLKDLADELSCAQRQLSQSVNTISGHSFTYYVNAFRVNHLKSLLDDPQKQHFTILSLAEESGFNSKTTLVRIFRQHTGMTPSEYMGRGKE